MPRCQIQGARAVDWTRRQTATKLARVAPTYPGPLVIPLAVVVTVEGCSECPFYLDDDHFGADECELASYRDVQRAPGELAPTWCPLRTTPAVVQLGSAS